MKTLRAFRAALFAVVCVSLCLTSVAVAAQASKSAKDMVLIGDAVCTKCHDESEDYPVLAIAKTRHGVITDSRNPRCTSCHGDSTEHAKKGSDRKRPKPDITYRDTQTAVPIGERIEHDLGYSLTPIAERNEACLACHKGGKRMHWQGSTHDARNVACTSCHQIHTGHDRVRDKRAQSELCFSCHKQQRIQVNRPSRHPLREGKMGCSDCHNVHGSIFPKQLVRDNVNDTCYQCHMEKRGPFVRTHQPVQEDCSICHNPHGSISANLLKARSPWICQQCHEPNSHRGRLGDIFGNGTRANAAARGCLNCHTNIHGTNNPANISNDRTFRR